MKYLTPVLQTLLFCVVILVVFWVGPDLETRFFPVYSRLTVDQAYMGPDGLRVRFRLTKLRNCEPVGFAYFNGESPIDLVPLEPKEPSRPVGTQLSRLYLVKDVTLEQFKTTVWGYVTNYCHPGWTTRSYVYP